MVKETVVYEVPANIPEPYRGYIVERNGLVAKKIARILGISYLGLAGETLDGGQYVVPARTVTRDRGFKFEDDLYGAIVGNLKDVDKTVLHPKVHEDPYFAGLVLPGFTVYSDEELDLVYRMMMRFGELRLKEPAESDGMGQKVLRDGDEVSGIRVASGGLIVEPNLMAKRTVSIGRVNLGGCNYAFLARQKNDAAPEDGRDRYLGADVVVIAGSIRNLEFVVEEGDSKAVQVVDVFDRKYTAKYGVLASRISYDFLEGETVTGEKVGGVTDITARLGGTCPAVMEAILELSKGKKTVEAEVNLNYRPETEKEYEVGAVRYVDTTTLRLTAKVKGGTI